MNFQQLETLLEFAKPQEHVVERTSLVLNLQYAVKNVKVHIMQVFDNLRPAVKCYIPESHAIMHDLYHPRPLSLIVNARDNS